jgi:hypothetical protein
MALSSVDGGGRLGRVGGAGVLRMSVAGAERPRPVELAAIGAVLRLVRNVVIRRIGADGAAMTLLAPGRPV